LFQGIDNLIFVGNKDDKNFNYHKNNYLGEWDKTDLYSKLSNYANLVLLSDGEADPLVVKEALICGLGLVLTKTASANLDLNLPFINIIDDCKRNIRRYNERKRKGNERLKANNYKMFLKISKLYSFCFIQNKTNE
jgi:hypothetical protein